jgi:hypothetical protein
MTPALFLRASLALSLCWTLGVAAPAAAQSCPSGFAGCDNGGCCPSSAHCCPTLLEGCCDAATPFCCGDGTCAASPAECTGGRSSCGDYDIPCGGGCAPAGSQCCDFAGHFCPPQGVCTSETTCIAGNAEGAALLVVSVPETPEPEAPERASSPLRNPPDGTARSCALPPGVPGARDPQPSALLALLALALLRRPLRQRKRR